MSKLTLTSNIFSKPSVLKYSKSAAKASETVDLSSISINRENFDEFVHIADNLPAPITKKIIAIKDMLGNFAKHEGVQVDFRLADIPPNMKGMRSVREQLRIDQTEGFAVDVVVLKPYQKPMTIETSPIGTKETSFERSVFESVSKMVEGYKNNTHYSKDFII